MKVSKREKKERRHKRVRAKIKGTDKRPRLSVFRSNRFVWAQLIDDEERKTLAYASSKELAKGKKDKEVNAAEETGRLIAKRAHAKKIEKAVFDRGGYKYHGLIKALADGARKGGLKL